MATPFRFGPAVSAIALAAMIAGCAAPQEKTGFGGKADENVGLATRALVALNAKNLPVAIDYAERAVARTPDDAGFRALLGNAYFAAGRFLSAEAAYKESLTIYSNQPQVILKLALVETALGKKHDAVAFLDAGRSVLDASNYGLALALAGDAREAIDVLDGAARQPGADATVRQNLALAHALAGDWTEARTIAAQDVPATQLDSRIQQWMQLASPKRPADQVAALVGVTPAAVDQGEPVRLALSKTNTMMAERAPAPKPARTYTAVAQAPVQGARAPLVRPAPEPQPLVAANMETPAPAPRPMPKLFEAVAGPTTSTQAAPAVVPAPLAPKSLVAEASSVAAATTTMIATAAHKAQAVVAAFMTKKAPAMTKRARTHRIAAAAPVRRGNATLVMQIGSYSSPQQVAAGWDRLTQHYPALRAYLPLRARFDSPKGTFWRLSVQGFGNEREAIARCTVLKSHGGQCFVRRVAGDAPVQIASN